MLDARRRLEWLLWLQPNDPQLKLMMAEAIARDDSLASATHTVRAADYLNGIPDSVPEAVEARIREARLRFLLLRQPCAAERLLRRAIAINSDAADAYSLLWLILAMTGRAETVEPVFQKLWNSAADHNSKELLRDWFISQCDPMRFTAGLDERMGFRAPTDASHRRSELLRLLEFRRQEPTEPVVHAAVAQWFQQDGDLEQAHKLLTESRSISGALTDRFYLSVSIRVLVEVGELSEAVQQFDHWPEPRDGHEFFYCQGLLQEVSEQKFESAADSYAKAISIWPGHANWKCHFRRAACLALINDHETADAVRKQANQVQALFKPDWQERMRKAILAPQEPHNLDTIRQFYRLLNRGGEVQQWSQAISVRASP